MELTLGLNQVQNGMGPKAWTLLTLGEHVRIKSGESPSLFSFSSEGVPYFKVEQLNNDNKYLETTFYFIKENRIVPSGSLVFPKRGASILLNKIRILKRDSFMDTNLMAVTPDDRLNNEYLFYLLSHIQLWRIADTTSIPQINNKHILPLVVLVPESKQEQEAIANALSDADAYIESLEKLIEKKRAIKKGAMQELLTGKRRLPGFSGEWRNVQMSDLVEISKAGINPAQFPERLFEHYSLPAFDLNKSPVAELGSAIGSNKFLVSRDAILVSKLNPRIPRVWLPTTTDDSAICSTEFLVLIPKAGVSRDFVGMVCSSPEFLYQMELHATGTTGSHQRISPAQALEISFPAPVDLAEQESLSLIVNEMERAILKQEAKLSKARLLKQGMMQELLTGRIRLV